MALRSEDIDCTQDACLLTRISNNEAKFPDFATCFKGADVVAIAEVYSAGEDPIPGADRDHLVAAIRSGAPAS